MRTPTLYIAKQFTHIGTAVGWACNLNMFSFRSTTAVQPRGRLYEWCQRSATQPHLGTHAHNQSLIYAFSLLLLDSTARVCGTALIMPRFLDGERTLCSDPLVLQERARKFEVASRSVLTKNEDRSDRSPRGHGVSE